MGLLGRRDGTLEVDPERDFIRGQIKKLVALLARLVSGARGATEVRAVADARVALGDAFGVSPDMLDRLEVGSAVALLRDPERIRAYASLCAATALVSEPGDEASRLAERALDLHEAAPGGDDTTGLMGLLESLADR